MTLVKDASYTLSGACGVYSNNTAYTVNGNNYTSFGFGTWDKMTSWGYNRGVVFGVPNESGVVDLAVTRTQYAVNSYNCEANNWYSIPKVTYQFEVLQA